MLNLVFKFDTMLESIFFLLRGKGLELRSALQLRGKAEAKELPFSFFRERKGILLTVCLQVRAKQSQAHRATVANVVKLK